MLRDCSKIQPLLSEYVDDTATTITPSVQWRIKEHLDSCAVCAKIATDFSATRQLLQSLPTQEPSSDFERILAARLADVALSPKRKTNFGAKFWDVLVNFMPRRPVLASGMALAALLPFAIISLTHRKSVTVATPIVNVAQSTQESSDFSLEEIFDEHDAHQTAQSLEDATVSLDGTLLAKAN